MGESGSADWSNLPPDMIRLISKKLADITDFIQFRAVCPRWRSSTSVSYIRPQIPWFLKDRSSRRHYPDLYFYSLSSKEVYRIDCTKASGRYLFGPAHGYLLAYKTWDKSFSLVNPFTNNDVPLPYLHIDKLSVVKIDPDPTHIVENLVLSGSNHNHAHISAFYQPIEKKWNVIEQEYSTHFPSSDNTGITKIIDTYYNGMYYLNVANTGITKIIDVSTKSIKYTVPPPINSKDKCSLSPTNKDKYDKIYLIESSREILRVFLHDDEYSSVKHCHFHIHRLDYGNENIKPCWIQIDSIGDQILFLDLNNGFSLCANDFKGFKGNSIYFLKTETARRYSCRLIGYDDYSTSYILCRYDIEEGVAEALDCPFQDGGTWVVPSLR